MKDLQKFLAILQLTREQPQYGYLMSGISLKETSNLAEHHFLVAWIGLLLCKLINAEKNRVNTERVLELCLMHDLGELFGGDVSAPLSRQFPELKVHAQAIENRNWQFLIQHAETSGLKKWLEDLWEEGETKESTEAVVAKIADMMETQYFLEHRNKKPSTRDWFFRNHIKPLAEKMPDKEMQQIVHQFFDEYEEIIHLKGFQADRFVME